MFALGSEQQFESGECSFLKIYSWKEITREGELSLRASCWTALYLVPNQSKVCFGSIIAAVPFSRSLQVEPESWVPYTYGWGNRGHQGWKMTWFFSDKWSYPCFTYSSAKNSISSGWRRDQALHENVKYCDSMSPQSRNFISVSNVTTK